VKILRVILFISLLLSLSCSSSKLFLNKKYQFENPHSRILAILPVARPDFHIDSLITDAFIQIGLEPTHVINPFETRARLNNDVEFARLMNLVLQSEHTKAQLKAGPSLLNFFSVAELQIIQERLDMADLVIIPTLLGAIEMKCPYWSTYGLAKVRLYDLRTGTLVFQDEGSSFSQIEGKEGIDIVTGDLTKIMAGMYFKYVLMR